LSDNWQQKRTKREKVSYGTKLTSGNEADRNQSAMTATERDKTHRRAAEKRTLVRLAASQCYEAETIFESVSGVFSFSFILSVLSTKAPQT
jgi:hypothetical protein